MKKIILASASPRRKAILTDAGYELEIIPSCYDEKISNMEYSDELLQNCAYQKALEVKKRTLKSEIIVSADTVVVLNNKILGKPKNFDEAVLMLESLSNKTHFVSTSICILFGETAIKDNEKTRVTFKSLTKKDILDYLHSKKPFDKAGSYGIQDEGFDFVLNIEGNLDNVVGFPLKLFEECLQLIK